MPQTTARQALLRLAQTHDLTGVKERLLPMADTLSADLMALEQGLASTIDPAQHQVAAAAAHLMAAGGKRVRPVLCLLVAKAFPPHEPPPSIVLLAQVAELIHNATLMHDDVIDLGDTRRDRPTARFVFGNGASVLGGDLLLVQAMGLIEAAGVPGLLASMLDVLRRMIAAESLQLENRYRTDLTTDEYFAVSKGKTASLFEWAVEAGGRSVGATDDVVSSLIEFGHHTGIAFQLLDDLLDLEHDPASIGKNVLQDVQGGTLTLPIILALAEQPALAERIAAVAREASRDHVGDEHPVASLDDELAADLVRAVRDTGARDATRKLIATHTARALSALGVLPPSPARDALAAVATGMAERAR
ncbi:MAG: polyprenyl synthetase family protein [Deltaproteobacteria bacterium]|nr:polyprenyl synthetase family protein [Deltaproteobacteria bacterium]